jgi:hypothetical protein
MPSEIKSRFFFQVIERALRCTDCKWHSIHIQERWRQMRDFATAGELLMRMKPGESIICNQEGFVYTYKFSGDDKACEIGKGSDSAAAMLDAYEVLGR